MINVKRIGHATFETPDLERQIDYYTNIVGLVLAERASGRAYLTTRLGGLAVVLEERPRESCAALSFQVAPGAELADIGRALERAGLRSEQHRDPSPGIPKILTFADPKGTRIELFTTATPIGKQAPAAGIGPLKVGHLAFC